MDTRIFLASPHMGGYEKQYIDEAFSSNWIAPLGPNVDAFEKELSGYLGVKSAVALSSGTASIHLALKCLGITTNDIVFCSSLTFAASCNPIIYQNGTPVFIDSEPNSWNMSPIALEKALAVHKPKAIIVVNLYGQSADMEPIQSLCRSRGIPIIEDAAESLGATYRQKKCGTFGDFGIFSFNGNKIITTSGGGMLVSDNQKAIEKARFWATQAKDEARYYQHTELGYNYRMSNICAGIGRGQLRILNDRLKQKKNIYDTYKRAFENIDAIKMAPVCDYGEPNYWLSIITIDSKSQIKPLDIILNLEKGNIDSRPIWKPMHLQPFYSSCEFFSHNDDNKNSISETIFNQGVCLPSDTKMTDEDMERIIKNIKTLF